MAAVDFLQAYRKSKLVTENLTVCPECLTLSSLEAAFSEASDFKRK